MFCTKAADNLVILQLSSLALLVSNIVAIPTLIPAWDEALKAFIRLIER